VDLTASTAAVLAGLTDIPLTNPLDTASFLEQLPAELSVGSLDVTQVTGLLAQTRLDVGQAFDQVSLDKGIGEYGFTASQLEGAGFLKPGTVQTFLKDPAQLQSVLASPTVWTGKSGIGNLGSLLSDPALQSLTQNEIMVTALDGLRSAGVVTGTESPRELASFVQTASKFGVNTTLDWINGAAPPDITSEINSVAKSAQFAVNFVDTKAYPDRIQATIEKTGLKDAIRTAYGKVEGEIDESHSTNPAMPYSAAKNELRKKLQELQKLHQFNLAWCRLFYIYGDGQRRGTLYSGIKKAIAAGETTF
jgi:hypothetical protein